MVKLFGKNIEKLFKKAENFMNQIASEPQGNRQNKIIEKIRTQIQRPLEYLPKANTTVTIEQDSQIVGGNVKDCKIYQNKTIETIYSDQFLAYLIQKGLNDQQANELKNIDLNSNFQGKLITRCYKKYKNFNQIEIIVMAVEKLTQNQIKITVIRKIFEIQYEKPQIKKKLRVMHYGFGTRKSRRQQVVEKRQLTDKQKSIIHDYLIDLTENSQMEKELLEQVNK